MTTSGAEPAPPARVSRSHHKARTRQALIEAALALFASQGYASTSTEQIAESAGVSPRTFFRYFDTKDQVLFFGGDAFNKAVVRHVPEQSAELDDLAALAATLNRLAPIVIPLKPRIALYFRAIESSTTLMGQHARAVSQHNAAVAAALAARRSLSAPDERCRLAAQLATVAMDRAYQRWLGSELDLRDVTSESFRLLRDLAT